MEREDWLEAAVQLIAQMFPDSSADVIERLRGVDLQAVIDRLIAKGVIRRWSESMIVTAQLLDEGVPLVSGKDVEERRAVFERCIQNVTQLWLSTTALLDARSDPQALALSLTCLEELGKLSAERLRLLGFERLDTSDLEQKFHRDLRSRPFFDHHTKHYLAAMGGALINNRIDRILGLQFVNGFLEKAETGQLELLRQSCLYMGRNEEGRLLLPIEVIDREDAIRYVALAGEVLAEIGGFDDPHRWQRLLQRVQEFEIRHGLTTAKAEAAYNHPEKGEESGE